MNNVTTDYCLDIIRKFEVSEENKAKNVLGIEGKITKILYFAFFNLVFTNLNSYKNFRKRNQRDLWNYW